MSDRAIRAAIAGGATTLAEVRECTGAAECCGGCEPTVAEILDQELGVDASASSPHLTTLRPLRLAKDDRAA